MWCVASVGSLRIIPHIFCGWGNFLSFKKAGIISNFQIINPKFTGKAWSVSIPRITQGIDRRLNHDESNIIS